jgi:DNA polymerase I-like protein with 3'-5' exonuclease and polymerase domains
VHGLYGGLLVENLVQALSRDVIVDMALDVRNNVLSKGLGELIVNLVHDEIVCVVREDRAEAVSDKIKRIMSTTPHYLTGMPLSCTISIVDNYAEAK